MGLELLLYIALVGFAAWAIIKWVPMPAPLHRVVIVVAVIICVLIAMPLITQLFSSVAAL